MAKEDRKPLKDNFRQRPLKGTSLLLRIKAMTGSSNLENFNGSIKELAIECGYVSNSFKYMPVSETVKKNIKKFVYEYHKANKTNSPIEEKLTIIDDAKLDRLLSYSNPKSGGIKKLDQLVEKELSKPRTRNSPKGRSGKVNSDFTQRIIDKHLVENNLISKEANDESKFEKSKKNKKLKLTELVDNAVYLHDIKGQSEASICVSCGYKVKNINTFRKEFSEIIGCKLAPLEIMIMEMRNDPDLSEFWGWLYSKESVLKSSQELLKNKTEELVEIIPVENKSIQDLDNLQVEEYIETGEIFIDREKITSEVKRTYRNPKFRKKVLEKYGSNCCCCDIAIETLIEAAHIVPVENNGNDEASNGIPLCPTHHAAFDNFLFTINPVDNSIIYKEGLSAEDLQITKTECKLNLRKEFLKYRYKLFNE